MTIDQIIAFLVLGLSLVLFAWGRWRYDLVAVLALIAVTGAGLVRPSEALLGFGHPAVVTVAAVLVISRALTNSGIVDMISSRISAYTKSLSLHIFIMAGVCAVASAFMNNVGALAIMLPVALASCAERKRSPAVVLMPLAFGSILGGLMTLIGTPPNIIIATYRADLVGVPFHMFDFSPVGAPVAVLGVLFTALVGWRLVPHARSGTKSPDQLFQIEEYITEVRVKEKSPLIGKRYGEMEEVTGEDVVVAGRLRDNGTLMKPPRRDFVRAGHVLVLKADPRELKRAMDEWGLELHGKAPQQLSELESENVKLFETVVSPNSPLEGRSPLFLRRRSGYMLHLLAIARQGEPLRSRLKDVAFKAGDVLLMQGDVETAPDLFSELRLLPLPERGLTLGQPRKLTLAVVIFAAAILAGSLGLLPIAVAFLAAILLFVVADILPARELYSHIDWPVVVLLGGMIPVGGALQSTGATALIGETIVTATDGLPLWTILALIMVVTMTLSDVINNAATALVMAPIAVAVAGALDAAIDPFLMGVAVAASCAFLTPIGHQSNTLVMGPAGYHFGDYWRMGLPLEALILIVSVPLILWVWPA